jgi:hypothetical protein
VACNVQACTGTGQVPTSISGHIYDPAGNDPLYNVVVFVPQVVPSVFSHGPSCDSCGSLYTGQPLVATVTDAKGFFKLSGVPVMTHVPLVIQIGKWRRQLSIANVKACQDNAQTDGTLKLPSAQNNTGANAGTSPPYEGTSTVDDLPQIAISTGGADTLECLLQRVGVATNEYTSGATGLTTTNPNGHIHIFTGSGGAPTRTGSPASKSKLWDSANDIDAYDIVILSCEGAETTGNANDGSLSANDLATLHTYAGNGGRVFASHFHYAWFDTGPFGGENLATWSTGSNGITDLPGGNDYANLNINTGFTRGQALHDFLKNVNALGPANAVATPADGTGADELNIQSPRHNADVSAANTPSQVWMSADTNNSAPNATEYFSFDTPVGGTGDAGAPYCGRVVFSDLHVGGASGDYSGGNSSKTPTGCTTGKLSPQERALEFMLFDLSSCPSTGSNLPPPTCTPLTTCPASVTCGPYPNGCGTGDLNCGSCPTGESCVNGACVGCTPLTACPAGQACGTYPNGCGTGTITCGTCPSGASCVNGACQACVPLKACPVAGRLRGLDHLRDLPDRSGLQQRRVHRRLHPRGVPGERELRPGGGRLRRPHQVVRDLRARYDVRRRRHAEPVRRGRRECLQSALVPHGSPRPTGLRPDRGRLRRHQGLRRLHASADLRRRRDSGHLRRSELHAEDLPAAQCELRSGGGRLRWAHPELRNVHGQRHVRGRRRGERLRHPAVHGAHLPAGGGELRSDRRRLRERLAVRHLHASGHVRRRRRGQPVRERRAEVTRPRARRCVGRP